MDTAGKSFKTWISTFKIRGNIKIIRNMAKVKLFMLKQARLKSSLIIMENLLNEQIKLLLRK